MRPRKFKAAVVEGVVIERKQVIDELLWRASAEGTDRRLADADARVEDVAFGKRQANVGAEAVGIGQVVGDIGLAGIQFAMRDVVAEADAVIGEVWLEIGNAVGLEIGAALQGETDAVTGAEEVVLLQGDAGDEALYLRIADAEGEAAGGLLPAL